MMSAMDDDSQHRNISGIHPWDARRLRERFRAPLLELFAAFIPNGRTLVIVKPRWDTRILITPRPLRCELFLPDVPFILTQDGNLIPNRFWKILKV